MRLEIVAATVSILLATSCAEDAAPASPPAPPEMPSIDAGTHRGDDPWLDAGLVPPSGAGSGPTATSRGLPDSGAGCRTFVSDALIEHACFHARGGPYRDVAATSLAIDVSRPHTAFRVQLARAGAGYAAKLTYNARTAGAYALFASPGARVSLADPTAPAPSTSHPAELCPELPEVAAHMLAAGHHELEIVSAEPEAMIVIESLGQGGFEDAYRVVCDAPAAPVAGPRDASIDSAAVPPREPSSEDAAPPAEAAPRADPADVPPAMSEQVEGGASAPRPVSPASAPTEARPEDAEVAVEAPSDAPRVPDPPACRVDPVLEHACLHVRHGPFAEVDATGASGTLPSVSAPHTVYVLRLGAEAGRAVYRSTLPGQHVFYLDAALPLTLRTPDGVLTPSHVESVADCPGLARAYVFDLHAGTQYEAHLVPGGQAARMLVESVESLTFAGWDARFEPCT